MLRILAVLLLALPHLAYSQAAPDEPKQPSMIVLPNGDRQVFLPTCRKFVAYNAEGRSVVTVQMEEGYRVMRYLSQSVDGKGRTSGSRNSMYPS